MAGNPQRLTSVPDVTEFLRRWRGPDNVGGRVAYLIEREFACDDCSRRQAAARDLLGRQWCEECCAAHGLFPGEGL